MVIILVIIIGRVMIFILVFSFVELFVLNCCEGCMFFKFDGSFVVYEIIKFGIYIFIVLYNV